MKNLVTIGIALALMLGSVGTGAAHQGVGVNGLLLGGAGGAIVGQAIAGNPEGVLVGSILGGTLGMLIDIGSARDHLVVVEQPRLPRRTRVVYREHRDYRHEGWGRAPQHRYERPWRHERRDHHR